MCMLQANIQELMDLVKANEEAVGFDLGYWFHNCGTFGCLVGNHLIATDRPRQSVHCFPDLYGMTNEGVESPLFGFLFDDIEHNSKGWVKYDSDNELIRRNRRDKEAALARVRKTIYYILRKRELMPPRDTKEQRDAYDKSRSMGDVQVTNHVLVDAGCVE